VASQAQDVGRVISSTPIVQQVATPRQVCSSEQVAVPQQKSGAGALMGALAGGAIGNSVGRGAGNAAATMLGVMGGAIVGDRIEGAPMQVQSVQHCVDQSFLENRTVGYNVEYEFGGKRYNVQMPNNPGPTIAVQVAPVGAQEQAPMPVNTAPAYNNQPVYSTQPVYVQSSPVVVAAPAQVYYTQPYYYPPVSLNFGLGYWGGGRRWR
jgi:uncharacterized protein YcfJ